jgi:hypothetical protein
VTLSPLPAAQALDAYFLEARARLLDLAAILDRIDRGPDVGRLRDDLRLARLRQAIGVLAEAGPDRAARIQEVFSLPYDPNWQRPSDPQAGAPR